MQLLLFVGSLKLYSTIMANSAD